MTEHLGYTRSLVNKIGDVTNNTLKSASHKIQKISKSTNDIKDKMKFEIDKRIITNVKKNTIIETLEECLKKNSITTKRFGPELIVESIKPIFASFNHRDTTRINIFDTNDGYMIQSETYYRPSFIFWIIVISTFMSITLSPIGFLLIIIYLKQKNIVYNKINDVFNKVKNIHELKSKQNKEVDFEYLKKLSQLRDKGILTEDEYLLKKKESLST